MPALPLVKSIYVDLDDVLCHAARHFLRIVEREFGKAVAFEQLENFDVGHSCGLTPSERDELYRIVHLPEELLGMEPIGEAVNVLTAWAEGGYEIAIVTGRPPETGDVSLAWLARHRIPHHSFTIVDKYGRFAADSVCALSLHELAARRFCWAVEDSLPMARFLSKQMRVPVALLDRPWNRCAEESGIVRCFDWKTLDTTKLVSSGGST